MQELKEMKETKYPHIKICECESCIPPAALGDFFGVDRMFEALQMHQPESVFSCILSHSPRLSFLPSNAHTLHYHVLRALKNMVEEITQSCHYHDSEKWFGYHPILFQSSYGNGHFTAFHPIHNPDSFRDWREYMGFEKRDSSLEQAEEKARQAVRERDQLKKNKKGKKRKKEEEPKPDKEEEKKNDEDLTAAATTLYPLPNRSSSE